MIKGGRTALSAMASFSDDKQSRCDHVSLRSVLICSLLKWREHSLEFLMRMSLLIFSPVVPNPCAKSAPSKLAEVRIVASKPEVYASCKSPKCSCNDRFQPATPQWMPFLQYLGFPFSLQIIKTSSCIHCEEKHHHHCHHHHTQVTESVSRNWPRFLFSLLVASAHI